MKSICAIFSMCLMAVTAGTLNYEKMVAGVVNEMEEITNNVVATLQHQVELTVLEPMHNVETAVDSFYARKEESEECFAAQEQNVVDIVDAMHNDMTNCGGVAARTSAEIANDIHTAAQQLIYNGYSILRTYQTCRNISNSLLQKSCYARLTVMVDLYFNNARQSIVTIKESTNKRIPAVAFDANDCTHNAAQTAVQQLDNINANMDACIEIMI